MGERPLKVRTPARRVGSDGNTFSSCLPLGGVVERYLVVTRAAYTRRNGGIGRRKGLKIPRP